MLFNGKLPEAFFRRILFRSFKYAAIYHVLLGKESDTLDAQDIGWSARVALLHLQDAHKVAARLGLLGETLALVERARLRGFKTGKPLTARKIQQAERKITNADDARAVLALTGT